MFVDIMFSNHFGMLQSVHNKYAIALIHSESVTVDNLPKFMSKLAHLFVKHAGKIRREITGSKRYSDLEQGSF